jgi:DNA mismatch endonuclease (patch repair protein)
MSVCHGSNPTPGLAVRSNLYTHGFRFVFGGRGLPSRPDMVLPRYQAVFFING